MGKEILFGKNAIIEAMRAGREIYHVVVSDEVLKKEGELRKHMADLKLIPEIVESKKMKQLIHQRYQISGQLQGMVAEVAEYGYLDLDGLINGFKHRKRPAFLLMLDGLEDVHNLGAILRSAEAVGVDAVIVPQNRSVRLGGTVARLSVGAVEYVPVVQVKNLSRTIERLKKEGVWFIGTDANESQDYRTVDMRMDVCVIIGSEGRGMSRLVKEACDFKVHLPMVGKISSLNASVATAVLLYEVYNQRNPIK